MRIAVLGAAAAALLGGTLAITPLSTVGNVRHRVHADGGGGSCDRLAVLIPAPEAPHRTAAAAGTGRAGIGTAGAGAGRRRRRPGLRRTRRRPR